MKFNEYNTVEKPILEWLALLGWTVQTQAEVESQRPDLRDPLMEGELRVALLRLNSWLTDASEADKVIAKLRQVIIDGDNQEFLAWLRSERSFKLRQDAQAQTVHLLDFHSPLSNSFIATNQFTMTGGPTHDASIRCDMVLLVNGMPLVVIEAKSLTASHKDDVEAVKQLARYQRDFPAVFVPNQFMIAAYELGLKYAATGATRPTDFAEWKISTPHDIPANEPLRRSIYGLLDRANVIDFVENFIAFERRDNTVTKKMARYQQVSATNKIVERVVKGEQKRGLIWHTQGSGKSLTMVFTAGKLRRHPSLNNPTVFIVIDRKALDEQISSTFVACDFPNIVRAFSTDDLRQRIVHDHREVIVTTIQKFDEMGQGGLVNDRDNIIVLVDEAHRSQEGELGSRLEATFKNAYFFGFTGTPIDRDDRNTHRTFGVALAGGKAERYLDYYSIKQAIADGATVPIHYSARLAQWQVNHLALDEAFDQTFGNLTSEERELLKKENATNRVLINHPRRVKKIVEDIVNHFRQTILPNEFKAQIATFDRKACVLYKTELDMLLGPNASEVIYSPGLNDEEDMRAYHYTAEKQRHIIERFKNPADPLRILIVTDMLLTGFDAPVEQVLYVDKPLRDHTLLQAVARTNRPYPNKLHGLIIDYYGVFQNLQAALNFNEDEIEDAVIDLAALQAEFPKALADVLVLFDGIARDGTNAALTACLNRLDEGGDERLTLFETGFKRVQLLYETLSPDGTLVPYLADYEWLCRLVIAYNRRFKRQDTLDVSEYGAKTRELIYRDSSVQEIERQIPVYALDENYLIAVDSLIGGPDAQAQDIEKTLRKELTVKAGTKPAYESLAKRLERIIQARRDGTLSAVEMMKQLQLLAQDVIAVGSEAQALGLSDGEDALLQLVGRYAPSEVGREERLQFVRDVSQKVKSIAFAGWQSQQSVRHQIERDMTLLCLMHYPHLNLYPGGFLTEAMAFIQQYY